jgi:chloramphenicol 3-O phosphotransferase
MQPASIILHGPSSSGKTSLARALQALWPTPLLHVDLDAFELMSEGARMPSPEVRREAFRLHCANLQATLRNIATSQFSLVLDFVLRDSLQFTRCLDALSGRAVYVIGVRCDLEVMEARERQRGGRDIGLSLGQFGHPEYRRSYDLVIDTTRLTPEDGAKVIWNFAAERQAIFGGTSHGAAAV